MPYSKISYRKNRREIENLGKSTIPSVASILHENPLHSCGTDNQVFVVFRTTHDSCLWSLARYHTHAIWKYRTSFLNKRPLCVKAFIKRTKDDDSKIKKSLHHLNFFYQLIDACQLHLALIKKQDNLKIYQTFQFWLWYNFSEID